MSENAPRDDDDEDESDRGTTNIVIAAFVALVIAVGIWLVNALLEQRRLDDCAATALPSPCRRTGARAFPGEVGTGSPQKMRSLKEN